MEIGTPNGRKAIFAVSGFSLVHFTRTYRVVLLRDITEQQHLHHSMGRIEHLAAVAHLTAGVTHNFNNLFAIMMLNAELLQVAWGHERVHLARQVAEAAERGGDLCRKLMTFARTETPSISTIPVSPLLQDLVTLIQPEAHRKQITVTVQVPDGQALSGDPGQVRQVMVNLLLNGIDASGQGGRLLLGARREGDQVHLSVGPEIPPEQLPVIFLPFFGTKSGAMNGVGMGLAVSHSLDAGMGGSLSVSSSPGELTTFTVTPPASTM